VFDYDEAPGEIRTGIERFGSLFGAEAGSHEE
jgi:hypothetical protein